MEELLKAVNALFEARSNGMLTAEEWERLESTAKQLSSAMYPRLPAIAEWRTHDELNSL